MTTTPKALASRAATSGQPIRSVREHAAEVMARCALCTIMGPKDKLAEHMATDPHWPAGEPTFGWTVSIAPRLRARVSALAKAHGLTMAQVVNAAVEGHFKRLEQP